MLLVVNLPVQPDRPSVDALCLAGGFCKPTDGFGWERIVIGLRPACQVPAGFLTPTYAGHVHSKTRRPSSPRLPNRCAKLVCGRWRGELRVTGNGDKDQALLAFLRGSGPTDAGEDPGTPAMAVAPDDDDVDALLRAMGYNRYERERLRRGRPRLVDGQKYRAVTVKRFIHYLAQRLPTRPVEDIAELAQAWARLTSDDLDLAQRWWDAGVDPGNPGQLASAIRQGFRVQDLAEVVQGRTIAEHLQAGNSIAWCLAALHWRHSA